MARKSIYDPEALKPEICAWISEGKTLRDYTRQLGKPKYSEIYRWLADDPSFSESYARAREAGHDVIADEIIDIVDARPPPTANGGTDAGFVSWQKNRAWTRMQLLAKWSPKRYGDAKKEVELSGPNGGPVNINSTVVDGRGLDADALDALVTALESVSMRASEIDEPYVDEDEDDVEER